MSKDLEKKMMKEEYKKDFGGCIWIVGFFIAIVVSAIVILCAK